MFHHPILAIMAHKSVVMVHMMRMNVVHRFGVRKPKSEERR